MSWKTVSGSVGWAKHSFTPEHQDGGMQRKRALLCTTLDEMTRPTSIRVTPVLSLAVHLEQSTMTYRSVLNYGNYGLATWDLFQHRSWEPEVLGKETTFVQGIVSVRWLSARSSSLCKPGSGIKTRRKPVALVCLRCSLVSWWWHWKAVVVLVPATNAHWSLFIASRNI